MPAPPFLGRDARLQALLPLDGPFRAAQKVLSFRGRARSPSMLRRLLPVCLAVLLTGFGSPVAASGSNARGSDQFRLAPQRPGTVDAYILSFGLWGPQSVFE